MRLPLSRSTRRRFLYILGAAGAAASLPGCLFGGGSATTVRVDPHLSAKPGEDAPAREPRRAEPGSARPGGGTYLMKDRIVNLADPGGRRYLRFSAAIEFAPLESEPGKNAQAGAGKDADKQFQAQVRKFTPAVEDAVVTVLSSKGYDEVRTVDGREQSKREIRARVQSAIGTELTITNVYFTEFVVQ